MKIENIFTSMHSASFEIMNDECYYTKDAYDIYLDNELYSKGNKTNVFSLFNLNANTKYILKIVSHKEIGEVSFQTDEEIITLNVKDFYAVGDGVHEDTMAITAAIMCCPKKGRVLIPKGKYLVSSIFLKSDIQIELAKDAVLLGNIDRHKYAVLPSEIKYNNSNQSFILGTWEGEPDDSFASVITGVEVSNVKIYGEGIIDENAHNSDWWINHRQKRIARRPKGIFLNRCDHIELQGITICNTPSWNQHPFFSKNLKYIDLKLNSPKDSPTTDGCDPESCENVLIAGVNFSVGDDCIAIKSGKLEMGKKYKTPSKNITIRNCLMQYGHGGVTLGSEMSGGIANIKVNQCIFFQTDRGLRIKSQRGRGKDAVIDGITFENIVMDQVKAPLVINMFYKAGSDSVDEYRFSKEKQKVDERTPYLGEFNFHHIKATDIEWGAGAFYGLPEQPIKRISIKDMSFSFKKDAEAGEIAMTLHGQLSLKQGILFSNVKEVVLEDVTFNGQVGEEVILENVEHYVHKE